MTPVRLTAVLFAVGLVLLWGAGITSARHLAANLVATYFIGWGAVLALSGARGKDLHARFLTVTLALVATLLLIEGLALAGLVDYRHVFGARHERPWLSAGNHYDRERLFARDPGLVLEVTHRVGNIARTWCLPASMPPRTVTLRYDTRGFRNDESRAEAEVAVLGDSYVEAVETPIEHTFPVLLEQATGTSTVNLGVSGYGPQQQLAVLESAALTLEPRLIVWSYYEGNDLEDYWEYEQIRAEIAEGRSATETSRLERTFFWNALAALYEPSRHCTPHPAAARSQWGLFEARDAREHRLLFVDHSDPFDARQQAAFEGFLGILDRAHERASSRGIDLVLLFVPTKFRVYQGSVELAPGSDCHHWSASDLPERLASIAAAHEPPIRFVDLTGPFREAAGSGELVYLPDDTHWTEEGHRIAARVLAPVVREQLGHSQSRAHSGGAQGSIGSGS